VLAPTSSNLPDRPTGLVKFVRQENMAVGRRGPEPRTVMLAKTGRKVPETETGLGFPVRGGGGGVVWAH
jgi:hypothetical protein